MTEQFNRYREFVEQVEKNMDHVVGSHSRGNEIPSTEAFRQFWDRVHSRPAMLCQWERRTADHGFERERDAVLRLIRQLPTGHIQGDAQKAA
jgi:hypothetical protein